MRRRTGFGLAGIFAALVLTACGPARVSVIVELDDEDGGQATLLNDVVVRLLPYDRDFVFDSLTAASPTPEPGMPAELLTARDEITRAQQEWRDADVRWGVARDTMKKLSDELAKLNPGMDLYKELFAEFELWERQQGQLDRTKGSLFETFDSLDNANRNQMDSFKIVHADWAEQAFEDVGLVIEARIEKIGLEEAADTTGVGPESVEGVALFEVPPGEYWVYARHELPYDELYWNVPLTVTRGDPVVLRLTRANAQLRPIF